MEQMREVTTMGQVSTEYERSLEEFGRRWFRQGRDEGVRQGRDEGQVAMLSQFARGKFWSRGGREAGCPARRPARPRPNLPSSERGDRVRHGRGVPGPDRKRTAHLIVRRGRHHTGPSQPRSPPLTPPGASPAPAPPARPESAPPHPQPQARTARGRSTLTGEPSTRKAEQGDLRYGAKASP